MLSASILLESSSLGSGRGAAWLARLLREQEVGGSNPLAPTNFLKAFLSLHLGWPRVDSGSRSHKKLIAMLTPQAQPACLVSIVF